MNTQNLIRLSLVGCLMILMNVSSFAQDTLESEPDSISIEINNKNKDKKVIKITIENESDEDEVEEAIIETEEEVEELEREIEEEVVAVALDQESYRKKVLKTRWMMLDLGINGLLYDNSFDMTEANDGFTLNYGKSIEVIIHIVNQRLSIYKHKLNLDYGINMGINNYFFDSNAITLNSEVHDVELIQLPDLDTEGYKKSKLVTTNFYIPVMLQLETAPKALKRSFRLGAGGYFGINSGGHTKIKTTQNTKLKAKYGSHLTDLVYGLQGEIGYSKLTFYARYGLNELFEENRRIPAYEFYPVSAGIRIVGF